MDSFEAEVEREREKVRVKRDIEDSGATRRREAREIGERIMQGIDGKRRGFGHGAKNREFPPGQFG